jgi:hypothetical protein
MGGPSKIERLSEDLGIDLNARTPASGDAASHDEMWFVRWVG